MLVLIAIMLIGFMATVAFSVDIAFMHLTRTELRTATDAASKAAALTLSQTFDRDAAIDRGQQIAALNTVGGDPLLLDDGDFDFGRSEETHSGRFVFDASATPTNSVRVNGRRTAGSVVRTDSAVLRQYLWRQVSSSPLPMPPRLISNATLSWSSTAAVP